MNWTSNNKQAAAARELQRREDRQARERDQREAQREAVAAARAGGLRGWRVA